MTANSLSGFRPGLVLSAGLVPLALLSGCAPHQEALSPAMSNASPIGDSLPQTAARTTLMPVRVGAHQAPENVADFAKNGSPVGNPNTGCPDRYVFSAKMTSIAGDMTITYQESTVRLQCPAIVEANGQKRLRTTIAGLDLPYDDYLNLTEITTAYDKSLKSPVGTTIRFDVISRQPRGGVFIDHASLTVEAPSSETWNGKATPGINLHLEDVAILGKLAVYNITFINPSSDVYVPLRMDSPTRSLMKTYDDMQLVKGPPKVLATER